MNDRYLFRAKLTQNCMQGKIGDWAQWDGIVGLPDAWKINPATIGQCTGLKDKNAKLIFEGNIVKIEYPHGGFDIGTVSWNKDALCYYLTAIDKIYENTTLGSYCIDEKLENGVRYEIIGNIHDNPELLEVNQQ